MRGEVKMYKGIDVSTWQNNIDWSKVKESGVEFAIIREGYGKNDPNQIDDCFHINAEEAQKNGIPFGVYHYSYAQSVNDAANEANFCLSNINKYKLEYPVVLDIEDSSMQHLGKRTITDICKAFCEQIEQAGYYAMIYCNVNWLENYLYKDELLTRYDLWLAHWKVDSPKYECGIWQYSDSGKVSGISGNVDMNISYKDYPSIIKSKELNGFKQNTTQVTPAPTSPQETENSYTTHIVKSGDTLWGISERYLGSGAKYKEVKSLNGLTSDMIYPGQTIKIPTERQTESYTTYTVQKGDTLWSIANRFLGNGSRYNEIMNLNGLTSTTIYPGQILNMPN